MLGAKGQRRRKLGSMGRLTSGRSTTIRTTWRRWGERRALEMQRTKMTVRRANNAVQAPLLIVTVTRRRSCCLDLDRDEDVKIGTTLLVTMRVIHTS